MYAACVLVIQGVLRDKKIEIIFKRISKWYEVRNSICGLGPKNTDNIQKWINYRFFKFRLLPQCYSGIKILYFSGLAGWIQSTILGQEIWKFFKSSTSFLFFFARTPKNVVNSFSYTGRRNFAFPPKSTIVQ